MKSSNRAMKKLRTIFDKAKVSSDFGNGRFVRKIIEEAEMNLAERLLKLDESQITDRLLTNIEECDIPDYKLNNSKKIKKIGFCV